MSEQAHAHEHPNLRTVRAYLAAIEAGAGAEQLAAFFTPDAQQREFPNRLVPAGAERGLADLLAGRERGRQVVEDERYEVHDALVDGDRVAVELTWTARLRVPLGAARPGDRMHARCGVFFTLADGRIARQHNYDCFSAF